MPTTNDVQKFIIDGTEVSVADATARTNASNAQTTANEAKSSASSAQSTANTNKTAISTIKGTKVVKTCTYDSTNKSLTITTGNIGG